MFDLEEIKRLYGDSAFQNVPSSLLARSLSMPLVSEDIQNRSFSPTFFDISSISYRPFQYLE